MQKIWMDRFIAVLLLSTGYYLYGIAGEFPPDADLFPKVIIVAVIVLSVLMIAFTFRSKPPQIANHALRFPLKDTLRPYVIFCCSVIYVLLMGVAGFFPSSIGMGILILLVLEAKKLKIYVLTIGGTLLFVYILFSQLLKVPLPTGMLFQ
ncbi:MAG: tripartite tricarboxylate transporter TctB family protein [Deltaproteobacteria bacterium]|nr:tripartite tricarboxylate transporter TctB family protein [Deltaproteobacteria bacterium]MBW2309118.1 tripartite tricarboxylate transporter TctB family protein [Deltaproteobacteria bacterium]